MTFKQFSALLEETFGSPGAEFRAKDLHGPKWPVIPQQKAAWLRRMASEGKVEYHGDEREYRGYGPGRKGDYYRVEPYWIWVGSSS